MKKSFLFIIVCSLCAWILFSCSPENTTVPKPDDSETPDDGGEPDDEPAPDVTDEIFVPEFDGEIHEYDGEKADDADKDAVVAGDGLYHENSVFNRTIDIVYSETGAQVTVGNSQIQYKQTGAYVTVDLSTNDVQRVVITASGKCQDGQVKIYGKRDFKLILDGLDLCSSKGPAINCQSKNKMYVHLNDGTVNRLTDGITYSADPYYINPNDTNEDRKGCLFSEGAILFSGTGSLIVEGRNKHGIAVDDYLYVRPGVTIAVTNAVKNAIDVKGEELNNMGVRIDGGLVYANTGATAGKAIKTDLDMDIRGGRLLLNTSGGSMYDEQDKGTSSAAGIKTDRNFVMSGGTLVSKNTGDGGKGLNIKGTLQIDGGSAEIISTGERYVDNAHNLTSAPKGVKADGEITINGGDLKIIIGGDNYVAEGLEGESSLTVNGGNLYVYAMDDAITAKTAIAFNGGDIFAYSAYGDGIDTKGTLSLNKGKIISIGGSASGKGFDCDTAGGFIIKEGGTFFGLGGSAGKPDDASIQRSVIYKVIALTKDTEYRIVNSSDETIFTYTMPSDISKANLFFSSPDFVRGDYTIYGGNDVAATFTLKPMVTIIDNSQNSELISE